MRKSESREIVLDAVETLMMRGHDRPAAIVRMVESCGSLRTAARLIDAVRARWRARSQDLDAERRELVQRARAVEARGWQVIAKASNGEGPGYLNAEIGGLRAVLQAQARIASLLGADAPIKAEASVAFDPVDLAKATETLLAGALEPAVAPNPLLELYS